MVLYEKIKRKIEERILRNDKATKHLQRFQCSIWTINRLCSRCGAVNKRTERPFTRNTHPADSAGWSRFAQPAAIGYAHRRSGDLKLERSVPLFWRQTGWISVFDWSHTPPGNSGRFTAFHRHPGGSWQAGFLKAFNPHRESCDRQIGGWYRSAVCKTRLKLLCPDL